MAGAAQQPQGGADNSLAPLWLAILLFIVVGIIWYLAHDYIVGFIFQIKLYQAKAVYFLINELQPQIAFIQNTASSEVSFQDLSNVSDAIGQYVRYPVILLLAIFGIWLIAGDASLSFRKTYNMKLLAQSEQSNWPQIKPVLKLDLISQDIDKGPWAMAMTPLQFAKKYHLLQEEPVIISEQTIQRKVKRVFSVISPKAKQVFTLQLGEYFQNPEELNIHTKALFTIFAARINHDRDSANKLLKQIAISASESKLNFSGMQELLNKHKNSKLVQAITTKHAFVYTVMASLLVKARKDGVLATSEFLWLKPIDRSLWYMLNSVGRQTPFVEISGPFAHWLAEKEFDHKIIVPIVDEAVRALEIAIKEIVYNPEED
jgi:intracellular multiplication protein IcmP